MNKTIQRMFKDFYCTKYEVREELGLKIHEFTLENYYSRSSYLAKAIYCVFDPSHCLWGKRHEKRQRDLLEVLQNLERR